MFFSREGGGIILAFFIFFCFFFLLSLAIFASCRIRTLSWNWEKTSVKMVSEGNGKIFFFRIAGFYGQGLGKMMDGG